MTGECNLLLIEDSDADAFLLQTYLDEVGEGRIRVERAGRLREGLAVLSRRSFDILLLDLSLPDSRGIETLTRVLDQAPDLPVVVLTGLDDQEMALRTVHLGAQDYLVKDHINAGALGRVIRYSQERHRFLARLQELDRLKSSFVSMASHEMRTPLAIIREFVSLVRDGVTGEIGGEQAECLDAALRNCDRLADLIKDLLDLEQIESGKLRLRRTRTAAAPMLRQVYDDFLPRYHGKDQVLELELSSDLPEALCDPDRIMQVLVNLVGNAHKFTPGGGTVTIRGTSCDGSLRLEVEDTGGGIPREDREIIFDAFTQPSRKDRPGAQGTGLGLAISRSIVEMHGGVLGVESEVGEGSRFFFDLPTYREERLIPAFVEDSRRLARSKNELVTLALLRVAGGTESAITPPVMLEEIQALAVPVFRCREDDTVRVERDGMVAFLLTSSEEECRAALDELRDKLAAKHAGIPDLECSFTEFNRSFSTEDWLRLATRKWTPLAVDAVAAVRRRILIVDDDETILGLMAEALEDANLGLDVQSTTSGYDACVRFGEFEPDLVILDIHLEDIDGTEVFRSMKRGSYGSMTRFLAISGLVGRIGEMMELGCDSYLAKPFELSALVSKVVDLVPPGGSVQSTSGDGPDCRREANCL